MIFTKSENNNNIKDPVFRKSLRLSIFLILNDTMCHDFITSFNFLETNYNIIIVRLSLFTYVQYVRSMYLCECNKLVI